MYRGHIDIDEADCIVWTQGLQKSNQLILQVNNSLGKLSHTSAQSSQLFGPILNRNNMLVTLQRNIESTLNSVASVKDLANEAAKYELILGKSIDEVGLKPYTQLMHKVDDMLDDIKSGNEGNDEFIGIMNHLSELIANSELELKRYFIAIINTIKDFDPMIVMEKKIPFPYYEDSQISEMVWILDYFYNNSDGNIIETVLIKLRTEKIVKSLNYLEPFVKKITSAKNAPYKKGSNGILNYTDALMGFIANENSLIDDLYSQYVPLKPAIVGSILIPILNTYARLIQSNVLVVKSNMENIGLYSFEMVESIQRIIRTLSFDKNLQTISSIKLALENVTEITRLLFQDTIKSIEEKVNTLKNIPSDNGVCEPTIDTVSKLRKLSEYKQGCLNAMNNMARDKWMNKTTISDKDSSFSSNSINENSSNTLLLSCFYCDCFDILTVSLEHRAQKLLSETEHTPQATKSTSNLFKQRIAFFILNNITLIEEISERSEIITILGNEGKKRLEKLKKKYIGYMVQNWRQLTSILMDSVHIDSTGKKSSKDKEQIKEKFKKFNDGFEDLVTKTKQYRLTNPSLKRTLLAEILALIMPMYERFYGRYKELFKNPRKHIKYTPGELTNVINQSVK